MIIQSTSVATGLPVTIFVDSIQYFTRRKDEKKDYTYVLLKSGNWIHITHNYEKLLSEVQDKLRR